MKVWTSEMLAVSKAGHDKGLLYAVISEVPGAGAVIAESDFLLLADGKHHTLDHPKKKKRKHVQLVTHLPENLLAQMSEITGDAQVQKIIKAYEARQSR